MKISKCLSQIEVWISIGIILENIIRKRNYIKYKYEAKVLLFVIFRGVFGGEKALYE